MNDSVFSKTVVQRFRLTDAARDKAGVIETLSPAETLLLFVFLSPDCPICKNYTPVLNALEAAYQQRVKMIGIIPGTTYNASTIRAFAQKYKVRYTLMIDKKRELTKYLHATITPEVILLNSKYELLYKGAVDNRYKDLGVQSAKATVPYLEDAIANYFGRSNIAVKRTKATGCRINDF
ncbi:MAG: redoxin domain-containing protein [Chitinophagaceae bacterium]